MCACVRPSGETGSVDGEEWVAHHAGQPTTSGTTRGGGEELDGSPAPGARAQPRAAGNKLSRQDSTRSVEVYAIQVRTSEHFAARFCYSCALLWSFFLESYLILVRV